jgi:SARP family transcriptional regulator, regulator of embCAB operon
MHTTSASTFPDTWIQVCGPLVIRLEGQRREQELGGRQARELVAFLVVNRRRTVSRDELLAALWPDDPPAGAARTLNTLLSRIRRALGHERIVGRGVLRLSLPPESWVDIEVAERSVHEAESLVAQGNFVRAWGPARVALATTKRGFLPDVKAEWTEEWRRHVENLRVGALEAMAACGLGIGGPELGSAERAARALIETEPLRETGYRYLMEFFAARDDPASALQVYETLRVRLRDALGVAPSRQTQELHRRLLAGTATPR